MKLIKPAVNMYPLSLVGLVMVICFFSITMVSAKVANRTLALVNGEPILQSEMDKNVQALLELQQRLQPGKELSESELLEHKKNVFDQMVDDKLMLQEAKLLKIKTIQRDVEKGIEEVKRRFSRDANGTILSEQEAEKLFKEELKKEGITNKEFEERIRDQVQVINLIDQEVKAKVKQPSEEEMKKLYDDIIAINAGKTIKGLSDEELKDMKTLAKYFNDSVSERVRCRHILIRVPDNASFTDKNKARRAIGDIKKELQGGADFSNLARKYSEDTESAKNGGDLGFFVKGWMVPEFEKAAFALHVGAVSDIIETEFGYHLIKCEEKKAAAQLSYDTLPEELFGYMFQFLFQQKAKPRFEAWIQGLRKKANIKINDESLQ
ncbi:MAG: peptidylprolyl isomerase [bacterium]